MQNAFHIQPEGTDKLSIKLGIVYIWIEAILVVNESLKHIFQMGNQATKMFNVISVFAGQVNLNQICYEKHFSYFMI